MKVHPRVVGYDSVGLTVGESKLEFGGSSHNEYGFSRKSNILQQDRFGFTSFSHHQFSFAFFHSEVHFPIPTGYLHGGVCLVRDMESARIETLRTAGPQRILANCGCFFWSYTPRSFNVYTLDSSVDQLSIRQLHCFYDAMRDGDGDKYFFPFVHGRPAAELVAHSKT